MASLLLLSHFPPVSSLATATLRKQKTWSRNSSSSFPSPAYKRRQRRVQVSAFLNPLEDPLVKEALKEPVAFMGGMFAGLLRLDLNEEPLREWISRTVEAAGITEEEIKSEESKLDEDAPQQIEIE